MPNIIDVATLRAKLVADTSQFQREMKGATGGFEKFASTVGKIGKVALGAGLAGLTAAAAGLGAVAKKTLPIASDFQDAIVDLSQAAAGMDLSTLEQAALAVGADTRILGASASGAADAMTTLFKAGVKSGAIFGDLEGYLAGTTELTGALKGAFDLAAASELDVVGASDLAAVALATFGGELETGEQQAAFITGALDNFVRAADASVADVGDLAEALKMAGPGASQLGYSIQDTNNALAILSTAGIKGSQAGSNLDAMLRSLSDPTQDAADVLQELGIELYDEQGRFKNLQSIVGDFEGALAGMTDEQRNAALGAIFTAQGQRSMNVLLGQGVEGWNDMANATAAATSIGDKAAAKAATLSGQWEAFQGTLETLGIQVGQTFLPIGQELLGWAGEMAGKYGPMIVGFFEQLAPIVQGVIWTLQDLLSGALGLDYPWEDVFPPWLADVMYQITDAVFKLWERLQPLIEQLGAKLTQAGGAAMGIFSTLSDWFRQILPIAIDMASTYWNSYLVPLFLSLRDQWEKLKPALVELWSVLKKYVPEAIAVLAGFWKTVLKPAFQAWAGFITDTLVPAIGDVATWLLENIPVAIEEARRVWKEVLLPALTVVYEFIRDDVIPIVSDVVSWLQENIPVAIAEARRVWEDVLLPALTAVWDFLDQYVLPILRTLVDIFVLELQIAVEVLAGLWEKTLKPALKIVWEFLDQNVVPIIQSLIGWLVDESGLLPALEKVGTFLKETFLGVIEKIGTAFKNTADALGRFLDKVREWRKTDVPEDYQPGSPPPLFYALRDINAAIAEMAQVRLPQLQTAWATVPATAGAMAMSDRLSAIQQSITNTDRSAHVHVNANYAQQQTSSDVARDVRTVLELMGWR